MDGGGGGSPSSRGHAAAQVERGVATPAGAGIQPPAELVAEAEVVAHLLHADVRSRSCTIQTVQ